jgi:hypothetical protein
MVEIKKQKAFIDKKSRQNRLSNMPTTAKGGKLGKGQVYKNNLLDADYTDATKTVRKLRGNDG